MAGKIIMSPPSPIHSGFAWTPPCYFGNPGHHLDYSFYLDVGGADCDKSVHEDIPRFEKLRCKSSENPAVGMFVMLKEDTSKNHAGFNKILGTVAEFICPMC
jgi:hypothetical protein